MTKGIVLGVLSRSLYNVLNVCETVGTQMAKACRIFTKIFKSFDKTMPVPFAKIKMKTP